MLPLVLFGQKIGQRNYFDCFEASYGGLLAFHIKNYRLIRDFYCLFDCFSLIESSTQKVQLSSRSFDINNYAYNMFGFEEVKIDSLLKSSIKTQIHEPFIIYLDEYYVRENKNYHSSHFYHCSLGKKIVSRNRIIVIDPGLEITKGIGYSADERIINIDNEIFAKPENFLIIIAKRKNNCDHDQRVKNKNVLSMFLSLRKLNFDYWNRSSVENNTTSTVFFGLEALEVLGQMISTPSIINDISNNFYKWIFPIYWKYDYLKRISLENPKYSRICNILFSLIHKMEIVETILLRLRSNYSSKLHESLTQKFNDLYSMVIIYLKEECDMINQS